MALAPLSMEPVRNRPLYAEPSPGSRVAPVADAPPKGVAPVVPGERAGLLWEELVQGRVKIVGHHVDAQYARLILNRRDAWALGGCDPGKAEMLRNVLTGCAQKVKALDLKLSASTVSVHVSSALQALGFEQSARQAPLALAMLAAARDLGLDFASLGYVVIWSADSTALELRIPRPEPALRSRLTPVEYEIVRAVIAGSSHKEIGAQRARSSRTVANQLANISNKLGVSGRFRYIYLAVAISAGREQRRPGRPSLTRGGGLLKLSQDPPAQSYP